MSTPVTLLNPVQVGDTNPIATSAADVSAVNQVGIELVTDGSLDGSWRVYASVDPRVLPTTDITNLTGGQPISVVHGTSSARNLYNFSPFVAGAIRAIFTATAGSGKVSAYARVG